MSRAVHFTVAQSTHPGLQREENQDNVAWFSLPAVELFIVVDGMGGAAGGRTAASMAVAAIHQTFENADGTIPQRLAHALTEANRRIHVKSRSHDRCYHGMGTTAVVMALVDDGLAHVAHVGDSRLYLYRNGCLRQITKDHTVLQRRIDSGQIATEEANNANDGHILYRALGPKKVTRPEVAQIPINLQPADLVLMCTDGLTDMVPDYQIRTIVDRAGTVEQVSSNLIDAALQAGGLDNITVQIIAIKSVLPNAQSTTPPHKVDQPRIPQPLTESRARRWKTGWMLGTVAVFIILAITLGAANGRLKTVFEHMQTKAAESLQSIFKSMAPVPKQHEASSHAGTQEYTVAPEAPKGGLLNNEFMFHNVVTGDTLEAIARKYGMTLERLLQINGLDADSPIYPGQTIVVHKK